MKTQIILKRIFLFCLMSSIIAFISFFALTTIHRDREFPHLLELFTRRTNPCNASLNISPPSPTLDLAQFFKYHPFRNPRVLGNISDFKMLLDCDVCDGEERVDLLFVIGSKPSHRLLRDVFRQFLTSDSPDVVFKTIFTFGQPRDELERLHLEEESAHHEDIVKGNFIDSYHNVTLRDLMGIRWAWQKCPQTRYIVRMDDDIAFDIHTLLEVLNRCCSHLITFIGCQLIYIDNPVRRDTRYAISPEEFNGTVFDTHCNGWLYVITPSMAYHLDGVVERVRMFWLNDAYITGSLVKELGLNHVFLDLGAAESSEQLTEMLASVNQTYSFAPTNADVTTSRQLFQFYAHHGRNKTWHHLPK